MTIFYFLLSPIFNTSLFIVKCMGGLVFNLSKIMKLS